MSYYNDVIKHVEETLGAHTSLRFTNCGSWHFRAPGKFTPYLKVAFFFDDSAGTFAYYVGDNVSCEGTGIGCRPQGCQRQERWNLTELDQALENLAKYADEAQRTGTLSVHGGVHLCWDEETARVHAY